jgi:hypothetical protein
MPDVGFNRVYNLVNVTGDDQFSHGEEKPNSWGFVINLAAVLRSLPVDPSWKVELAVSLACSKRSVLPRHRDWSSSSVLSCRFHALVADRSVGCSWPARIMGLRSLL